MLLISTSSSLEYLYYNQFLLGTMGKLGVIARHTQRMGGWVSEGINLFGFIDFNVKIW